MDQSPSTIEYAIPTNPLTRYRWIICALLFFATTVNYMDRQVLGIIAPDLQKKIGWNEIQYGNIVTAFQFAYAIGLLSVGRFLDVVGTRFGYALSTFVWALSSMAHALARTPLGFGIARFALGLGESGNFPAAIKTTAEWFPKKERALATGIFNSGSNVGVIVAALTVPFIAASLGWQWAFIMTGSLDLVWVIFWLAIYRKPAEHPRVSAGELALINQDPSEPATVIPWHRLLPHRQTWAFAIGKFLTDPVWWFFLFWLPKFLNTTYGLTLKGLALPLIIIYIAADVGSIGGGYISSTLIHRGWTVNFARKTAMFICAACVAPMILASFVHNLWITVGLISLAAAAHQGWSANLFTLVSDTFPRRAVGSVVGLGAMLGAVGGILASQGIGHILQWTHDNYVPLLTMAGMMYLITLLIIHLLVPRLEPAPIDT